MDKIPFSFSFNIGAVVNRICVVGIMTFVFGAGAFFFKFEEIRCSYIIFIGTLLVLNPSVN